MEFLDPRYQIGSNDHSTIFTGGILIDWIATIPDRTFRGKIIPEYHNLELSNRILTQISVLDMQILDPTGKFSSNNHTAIRPCLRDDE